MSVNDLIAQDEIRPIAGFEFYYVGRNGLIYSRFSRHGKRLLPRSEIRQIAGYFMPKGYHGILLCNGPIRRRALVHRVVLEAFVGPCPDGMECRHLDGNPRNNRLENLKWGTPVENASDKKKRDTGIYGERHRLSKLDENSVRAARILVASGWKHIDVALLFHVSRSAITLVVAKKAWKHVT